MGFLKELAGIAAPIAGTIIGGPLGGSIGGALGGLLGGSGQPKSTSQTTQQQLHPQLDALLFGSPGQQGLISKNIGLGNLPQSPDLQQYGNAMGAFLGNAGADMGAMRDAAYGMMSPLGAPQAQAAMMGGTPQMSAALTGAVPQMSAALTGAAPQMQAAQAGPAALSAGAPQIAANGQGDVLWNKGESFNAPANMQGAQATAAQVQMPQGMQAVLSSGAQMNLPGQNGVNVSGALDSLINGAPGANPYLTGAIQKGINQSSNAFGNMLADAKSATQDLLGGIRGGAMMAGQFGGSRQGLAEAKGVDSFNKNVSRAAQQFGQYNTDAAVAAQAGAYESDRNRQLSAAQGLSAQQYGAAGQQASMNQQNNQFNAGQQQQANSTTYAGQLSGALANAGYAQQTGLANQASTNAANQTNYAGQLQTNQANAGMAQQANLANQAVGNNAAQFGANAANAASLAQAQLGQNNNQFNAGQQNNLSQYNAGLAQSANQYNTGLQQQAGQFNAGQQQQANQYNTGLQANNGQFNAGQQQNANQFNTGLQQQTGLANLGNQQQTNLANLQALLGTNQLNSTRGMSGLGALSGLLGTAYQGATNQDNWALNRAQQVNNLVTPYLDPTGGRTTTEPLYSSTGGNMLSGAMMGGQLAGLFGGGGSGAGPLDGIMKYFGAGPGVIG